MEKFAVFILVSLLTLSLHCQDKDKGSLPVQAAPVRKAQGLLDYSKLREVDLGFITLSIPDQLQKQEKKCIEGGCWKFADDEVVVSVDRNQAAWRPTYERTCPGYSEEVLIVDGIRARFWSFPDTKSEFRFISGANFGTERNHQIGLGIYLSSKTLDTRELAKKVFASVIFHRNQ